MLKRVLTSLALAVLCVATLNVGEVHAFGFKQRYGVPTEAPSSGDGEFNSPFGIAKDLGGFTYISDRENHRIQKFDADGNFIAWAGRCTGEPPPPPAPPPPDNCDDVNQRSKGFSCTAATCTGGGPGANPGQFNNPHGIAIKFGKLYVADRDNHRLQVLDLVTGILEFPPFGTQGSGDGQFVAPFDVAVDSTGTIYVADSGNNRIQVLVENHPPPPNPPFLSFSAKFGSLDDPNNSGTPRGSIGWANEPNIPHLLSSRESASALWPDGDGLGSLTRRRVA